MFGLIFSACLTAFGATMATGAETRVTYSPSAKMAYTLPIERPFKSD